MAVSQTMKRRNGRICASIVNFVSDVTVYCWKSTAKRKLLLFPYYIRERRRLECSFTREVCIKVQLETCGWRVIISLRLRTEIARKLIINSLA